MIYKKINILLICLIWLMSSCSKDICDCFKSTGSLTSEERTVGEFTVVRMEDNVNVVLCPDTVYKLKVECGSGILKDIKTTVEDGRLRIRNTSGCNWVRDLDPAITVYVHFRELQELSYSSTGTVTTNDTLRARHFILNVRDGAGSLQLTVVADTANFNEHDGTADISIIGRVNAQYIYNNGMGPVNALGVASSYSFVNNRGTNDCFVRVKDRLEVTIDYTGNVRYAGNPPFVTSWINGEGKLIHLE